MQKGREKRAFHMKETPFYWKKLPNKYFAGQLKKPQLMLQLYVRRLSVPKNLNQLILIVTKPAHTRRLKGGELITSKIQSFKNFQIYWIRCRWMPIICCLLKLTNPVGIYLLKVNNRKNWTYFIACFSVFIVKVEHVISDWEKLKQSLVLNSSSAVFFKVILGESKGNIRKKSFEERIVLQIRVNLFVSWNTSTLIMLLSNWISSPTSVWILCKNYEYFSCINRFISWRKYRGFWETKTWLRSEKWRPTNFHAVCVIFTHFVLRSRHTLTQFFTNATQYHYFSLISFNYSRNYISSNLWLLCQIMYPRYIIITW